MQNTAQSAGSSTLDDRIRAGDRGSIASALLHDQDRIRRIIRLKLSSRLSRVFASQDVLSTVLRRIDTSVTLGKVTFDSRAALMRYADRVASSAIVDKARIAERRRRCESEEFQQRRGVTGTHLDEDPRGVGPLDKLLSAEQPDDRLVIESVLAGRTHRQTAMLLDRSPDSIKMRWQRIRARLKQRLQDLDQASCEFEMPTGGAR